MNFILVSQSRSDEEAISPFGKSAKSIGKSAKSIGKSAKAIPYTKTTDTKPIEIESSNDDSSPTRKSGQRNQYEVQISFSRDEGKFHGITQNDLDRWREAYPGVDLHRELAKMSDWILANPRKGNKRNWRRFVSIWLSKAADTLINHEVRSQAKKSALSSKSDEEENSRINTKLFYEWKEKSNGALNHCYVKNGYLINKENHKEVRVNMNPKSFKNVLCSVAGVEYVSKD